MKFINIILFSLLLNSCSNRKGEVHLLPNDFTGSVLIVYGVTDSLPLPLLDGYYLYSVPKSGIIYTSTPVNDGSVSTNRLRFYYQQANGSLRKLKAPLIRASLHLSSVNDTINPNENYVFLERNGIVGSPGHAYHAYFVSKPIQGNINQSLSKISELTRIADKKLDIQ